MKKSNTSINNKIKSNLSNKSDESDIVTLNQEKFYAYFSDSKDMNFNLNIFEDKF